ncbi:MULTISPECIES: cell envelope biogenesis protein TolA [unclassified Bradyrhizobium]|uniref:cell envelope biogenesis protein TolA n=1 Tax=unclassified Bradyrhizobium TaxID=2631580 RepID=UPI002916A0E9|nr:MULTISPECIES: cell envelope biogenesis protein TolA [unclassified Bradyrhizobium]
MANKLTRKLKTFQTSLGFFDLAIAAPSMKAALEAWGARSNLFHQGAARETDDPDIVAATLAKPGIVLKRPVGTNQPFTEHAGLPTRLAGPERDRPRKSPRTPARPSSRTTDKAAERTAALAFARAQKQREAERQKEEAALAKARARRDKAMAKAQAALDKARRAHEARADAIETERAALDERTQAEAERWGQEKAKLEAALRRAREQG